MICGYPVESPHGLVACGQCMNCRTNHKRSWVGRILLEASEYKTNSTFLTMTYKDEALPTGGGLRKSHVQDYIKRLRRKSVGAVRYFAVGEYGEKTKRPHYHMILFGFEPWHWQEKLQEAWPHGHVKAGECTPASASYTAGYCVKKLAESQVIEGQPPEFHIESHKPPLGAAGLKRITDVMYTRHGAAMLKKLEDVPNSYRIHGKTYPIPRHWVRKMRDEVFQGEWKPMGTPQKEWLVDYAEEAKRSLEEYRQLAQQHAAKKYARRNAKSRTL